eukprot:c20109_g1_i3.p1 GENE.c20109_g1_i3~~c20109_g1_i3.p1  ORF type:complete len:989 (+),score=212.67 c20109_g1_i3:356-2968(+)
MKFSFEVFGGRYMFDVKEKRQKNLASNVKRELRVRDLPAPRTSADFDTDRSLEDVKILIMYLRAMYQLVGTPDQLLKYLKNRLCLASENDATELVQRCETRIERGTLLELLDHLIDPSYLLTDTKYIDDFFKVIEKITSHQELFAFFKSKFSVIDPSNPTPPSTEALLRWATQLKRDNTAFPSLADHATYRSPNTPPFLSQVCDLLIESPLVTDHDRIVLDTTRSFKKPVPVLSGALLMLDGDGSKAKRPLLELDPLVVATELTRYVVEVLTSINLRKELLSKSPSDRAGLTAYSDWFNRVNSVVQETVIMDSTNVQQVSKAMDYWMRVAVWCFEKKNLSDAIAIKSALESAAIHRLKSRVSIPSDTARQYKSTIEHRLNLTDLKAYYQLTQWMRPPLVPYIGIVLTFLEQFAAGMGDTTLEDGQKSFNFESRRRMAGTIRSLEDFQAELDKAYPSIKSDPVARATLLHRFCSAHIEPLAILERSYEIVPQELKPTERPPAPDCDGEIDRLLEILAARDSGRRSSDVTIVGSDDEEEAWSLNIAIPKLRSAVIDFTRRLDPIIEHYDQKLGLLLDVVHREQLFGTMRLIASHQHDLIILSQDLDSWDNLAFTLIRCLELYPHYIDLVVNLKQCDQLIEMIANNNTLVSRANALKNAHRLPWIKEALLLPIKHFSRLLKIARRIEVILQDVEWDGRDQLVGVLTSCEAELSVLPEPTPLKLVSDDNVVLTDRVKLKFQKRPCLVALTPSAFVYSWGRTVVSLPLTGLIKAEMPRGGTEFCLFHLDESFVVQCDSENRAIQWVDELSRSRLAARGDGLVSAPILGPKAGMCPNKCNNKTYRAAHCVRCGAFLCRACLIQASPTQFGVTDSFI